MEPANPSPQKDAMPEALPPVSRGAAAMTVGRCVWALLLGLCPVVGIVAGIFWGYGTGAPPWKKTLAKATLVLQGIALCLLLAGLCAWIIWLTVVGLDA